MPLTSRSFPADTTVNAGGIVIDTAHERIHRGQYFDSDFVNTAWAAGNVLNFAILATAPIHLRASLNATGDARIQLFEGVSFNADGTLQTAVNRNRLSSKVAPTTIRRDPTVTVAGTEIHDNVLAGGRQGGAQLDTYLEFIFPASTGYLWRVTSLNSSAVVMSFELEFYVPSL